MAGRSGRPANSFDLRSFTGLGGERRGHSRKTS